MKQYIIKCTKPELIQTFSGKDQGKVIREEERAYLKDYWYFGMERYSYNLTKDITEAKIFKSFKEADDAKATLSWSSTAKDIKILGIETSVKLI